MKRLLSIYGGPRRYRYTENLLDSFVDGFDEEQIISDKVILSQLNISPCISCYMCSKSGVCAVEDDMSGIYEKIQYADIIVFAAPVYFGSVPAQAKVMIDRCQAFWSKKYLAGIKDGIIKEGYFISSCGCSDEDAFSCASHTVKLFFSSCNVHYNGELFVSNTDNITAEEYNEILKDAADMGRSECARILAAGN